MKSILGALFAVSVLTSGLTTARGQTLVIPKFHAVTPHPDGVSGPTPFISRVVPVFALNNDTNPELAAQDAAADLIAGMATNEVQADNVALYMVGFGHNNETFLNTDTRFFREGDRLDGLSDAQFHAAYVWPDWPHDTARAYRHPFPTNALPTTTNFEAPLREWFRRFCQEWLAMRQFGHSPHYAQLPLPAFVVFCTEPLPRKSSMFDRNTAKMLSVLATHTWWTTQQVPGYPTGTTLASLYGEMVTAHGWPADINDAQEGLDPERATHHERNRRFLIWYRELCQKVEDQVVVNCGYSLVAQHFPNAVSGDFETMSADGVSDTTPWFMDRIANSTEDREPARTLPRGWIGQSWNESDFFLEANGRWSILPQAASGTADCPSFFRLPVQYWRGANDIGWDNYPVERYGHQMPHLYLPEQPLETQLQTSLRTFRHALESSINSQGGLRSARQRPWFEFINQIYADITIEEAWLRPMVGVFRSKRVPGGVVFTSNADPNYPTQYPQFVDGWIQTSDLVKRVYDPRITGYSAYAGTVVTGEGEDNDPSRLDFTLRDASGQDRVVGLFANDGQTELVIEIGNLQDYYTGTNSWYWGFDITVECTSNVQGTVGQIQVMNWVTGNWDVVLVEEGKKYFFYTPNSGPPAGEEEYQSRRTLLLFPGPYVRSDGNMVLRAIHVAGQAVHSRYDLVQVVPHMITLPGEMLSAIQSDVNFDETVDNTDLVRYMNQFVGQQPAADVDLNGVVDTSDLAAFVANYVNGS